VVPFDSMEQARVRERDLIYEQNNVAYDDYHLPDYGGGIKCKNYEVCDHILGRWWFDSKGDYLCTSCDVTFGSKILEISEQNDLECPVCLETAKCVMHLNCEHYVCIPCFQRCYYGDNSGEPTFPYPEIEQEYYEDILIENDKWIHDYPLISSYHDEWYEWNDRRNKKYLEERYLRNCPICRK